MKVRIYQPGTDGARLNFAHECEPGEITFNGTGGLRFCRNGAQPLPVTYELPKIVAEMVSRASGNVDIMTVAEKEIHATFETAGVRPLQAGDVVVMGGVALRKTKYSWEPLPGKLCSQIAVLETE